MVPLTLNSISKYLTKAVIDKAFKLKTNSEDDVQSIEIDRASPAGEGFISAVYRVVVTGKHYKASFIAKAFVSSAILRATLRCSEYFRRETQFFIEVLPTLVELQKSCGAKERIQDAWPIFYGGHCNGYDDFLLIEDLAESQCRSISEFPTKFERDITLKTLAHFHAVSMGLRIKSPEVFFNIANAISEIYYTEGNRSWYASYLQNAIEIDKNALAEYEDPTESVYYKKFCEVVNNDVYGQIISLVSNWGDNPVINHGDAWCPNFMCSKERAVAIDFQILRCASLATDLSYFIILVGNISNADEFHEAVKLYYDFLEYYLKDMKIIVREVFSWETLQEELKKFGKFGLLAALTSIPLRVSERCDTFETFEGKYHEMERIPLEDLWRLTPITNEDQKKKIVNAVRVAVDLKLI